MLDKKTFIDTIEQLEALNNKVEKFSDAVKGISDQTNFICFDGYITIIIGLLIKATNDKDGWIEYWMYELDWGKKATPASIKIGKKNIPIKTKEDLYKLLVSCEKGRKKNERG